MFILLSLLTHATSLSETMVMVRKLAAYVMLGINSEGFKEIISLSIGENESVNNTCKKLNRQRSVFPSSTALLKALYLSTLQITKNGARP